MVKEQENLFVENLTLLAKANKWRWDTADDPRGMGGERIQDPFDHVPYQGTMESSL